MQQPFDPLRHLPLTYTVREELTLPAGRHMNLPSQNDYRFALITEQKINVTLYNGDTRSSGQAADGDLFLIPANALCSLHNITNQKSELVLISFSYAGMKRSPLAPLVRPHDLFDRYPFHTLRMPQARNWIGDFLSERERDDPILFYQLQSHLYAMASAYIQSVQQPDAAASDLPSYVEHSKQHLLKLYDRNIDIEELARSSGFSSSRFYETFRLHTGLSPHKYLTKIRLDTSLRMLAGSSSSVVEVAHAVGYSDEYYFSRLFKKHMGITPSDYALLAKKRIVNLSPVFLGDLSVLGITPYLSFERGWQENADKALEQIAASQPELILTGPINEELYESLSEMGPVTMLHWKQYSWKERLLDIGGRLGLSAVAERWISSFDLKAKNARLHIKHYFGKEPVLLVQAGDWGFRVYGKRMKKIADLYYKELHVASPSPVQDLTFIDTPTIEDIAALDCENILFFVDAKSPLSFRTELEQRWHRLRRNRNKKRCLFIQHYGRLNYNAAVYEGLIDQTVQQIIQKQDSYS